ncbi:SulP family inorganic anion transporter [Streptomyces telluris]|uniref:SulP family inorganic anion transporter n=1 Tax=Streptomyces telluris TaxID=2720021 RepID=A0A9X2LNH1_9ACTN|nr:SulP family inorganic anion transporter [Streptomyces telluris]MCQ8775116.1 SulP family inorganic anion transporter [Streptomyces telluris]NJP80983.1 SulP family inorganic anion transporter [Streptomyces telluris]
MDKIPLTPARKVLARTKLRSNPSHDGANNDGADNGAALRRDLRADFTASLVVFLIAVPLSVGIAVASGVPVELGLVTGVVGGILTGLLPGSSLQVSGPAAGLTVLVYEAVREFGLTALGVLVLTAGLLQIAMGLLRLGRWFRAISVAVIQGMLAGIGLVLMASQIYAMADARPPAGGPAKIAGLPDLIIETLISTDALLAAAVGVGTIAVLVLWPHWQKGAQFVPAPLVAVALATAVVGSLSLPVARIEVSGMLDAIQPPGSADFALLGEMSVLGTVLAFALIASAETLFSAAAVDRLHEGPRTDYNKELIAQGAGNTVCGALGALPMTAVIVRSSANVRAGAKTKAARVLHGVWLLVFVSLVPWALELIPVAALAGVLMHAGWKLLPFQDIVRLWREHRGEAVVLVVTTGAIVVTNLFEGVVLGLLMAVAKAAWESSHVHVETQTTEDGTVRVRVLGNANFLRLPKILDELDASLPPSGRNVELDLSGLRHMDHACRSVLTAWAERNAECRGPVATGPVPGSPPHAGSGPLSGQPAP